MAIRFALFVGLLAAVAIALPCSTTIETAGTKYSYDLSALSHATGEKDLQFGADKFFAVFVNLCAPTTACGESGQSVCQKSYKEGLRGYGATISQEFHPANITGVKPGHGVMVAYSGGDECGTSGRASHVYVLCDKTAEEAYITEVAESTCHMVIKIHSVHGCGTEA